MKKSHVSFILAAALAAALLAGCGSSGSSTEASGSKEAGSQSQAQDTGSQDGSGSGTEGALSGEITFWHSFTQGPRLETIQKAADKFMEENPDGKSILRHSHGMTFIPSGPPGLHPAMYLI